MAKPWSEVETSAGYLALAPSEQMRAKRQYASQVIGQKPEYKALAPEDKREALRQFFGIEKPQQVNSLADAFFTLTGGRDTSTVGEVERASGKRLGLKPLPGEDDAYNPMTTLGQGIQTVKAFAKDTVLGAGPAKALAGLPAVAKLAPPIQRAIQGAVAASPGSLGRSVATQYNEAGKVDPLQTAVDTGIGATAGAVLGAAVPVIADKAGKAFQSVASKGANMLGKRTVAKVVDVADEAPQVNAEAVEQALKNGEAVPPEVMQAYQVQQAKVVPPVTDQPAGVTTATKNNQGGFIQTGRVPLDPSTPEGQVEARISIDKSKSLVDKAAAVAKDAKANLVDDLAPIQKAEQAMGGGGTIYEGARLTRGTAGKVQQILDTGAVDYNTLRPVSKGMKQVIDDVRKVGGQRGLDEFRAYSVARRARELEKQGRATGVDLQSANDTIRKFHKQYGQSFKDLKQFQNGVLKYALDSGTISPDAYDAIRKANRSYVPFRRDLDEKAFSGGGRKFVNLQSGIKTLEGSDLRIVDPFESIIKNTHDIIAAADKNAVGQALVKLAAKNPASALIKPAKVPMQVTGVTVQEVEQELGIKIPPHLANEIIQVFRPKTNPLPEGVVKVLINGKPKLFEVDEDLYKGLTGLTREQIPLYVKLFSFPASTLRAGATLSPEFMAYNPARDTFTAFLQSKYGFVPVVDTMRGLFHAIGKTDLYKQWRLSGGDNAMLTTMDRGDVQKELASILQHPAERAARNILDPIAALRTLSEFSEKATRLGDFAKGVKAEGATKEGLKKAAFQSREVTLDFARMGNQMQNFNRMTAFLNARVQGWDKLARQLSDPKTAKKAWMTGVGGLTLPSLGLLAANMQDDRWESIPDWEKVAFWHVLVPGGPVLRVPKPPGYGTVFITPFERAAEWAIRKDPKALGEIAKAFGQELPGLVPTAITPALEAKADYSFFRRGQITPPGKEKLEPRYQFNEQNTETAKAIGDVVNLSPAIIENTVSGYAGGLGIRGLQVLDRLTGRKPVEMPPLEQAPVLKAFVSGVERGSDQRINDFWEAHRGAETKFKTFEMLAKEQPEKAQAYFVNNQAAIASYQVTKEFADALGDLRKAKDATARDESLPMPEKRAAIKDLQRQMGELSQQAKVAVEQVQRQAQQ